MGPVGRCDCVPSCDRGGVGARYGFMPVALRRSRSVGQSSSSARSMCVMGIWATDGRTDGQTDADGHTKRSRLSSPPEFDLARSLNWTRVGGVRSCARPSSDTESHSGLNESARAFFHVSNNLIPFVSLLSLLKSRLTRGHIANTQSCCVALLGIPGI